MTGSGVSSSSYTHIYIGQDWTFCDTGIGRVWILGIKGRADCQLCSTLTFEMCSTLHCIICGQSKLNHEDQSDVMTAICQVHGRRSHAKCLDQTQLNHQLYWCFLVKPGETVPMVGSRILASYITRTN